MQVKEAQLTMRTKESNANGVHTDEPQGTSQEIVEEDQSPIEQVALTVSTTDDPSMPVYTFRMWTIGIVSCILLAFVNQFFAYRTEPLTVSAISVQIASMPLGHFMANILPKKRIKFPGTNWHFSLNPGPFNMKEHVLITIFANAGAGGAYAISIVNIVKAFYKHKISFYVALVITVTTQSLGYGWAGIFRKYLVDPAHMWWPSNLVQVSLFRVLHEKDSRLKGGLTRMQFFLMIITISFCYYSLPGYLFPMLTSLSWVCWAWPNSITAHQIGSGLHGLGVGAVGLDWATISSFIGSPLATPWFAIANVMVGFLFVMYVITPAVYWGNVYDAKTFPIFSSALFSDDGQRYNFTRVIDHNFRLDIDAYNNYSRLRGSAFFMFSYGVGFAALTATVSHVMLFHGRDIWQRYKAALKNDKPDIHTRLMKQYKAVPESWFLGLLVATVVVSILVCELVNDQVQLRWWGVLLACGIALSFTLPIGVIAATTNQVPGLNLITEMIIGYLYPGRPVANVSFKTYGYISMTQAVSFLSDFKLGHYMKIPPRSMFIVQVLGTLIAAVVNLSTAWWLLTSIHDICNTELLPSNSPWTCPGDAVFFDASIIWGLIGPKRVFGSLGMYNKLNWFFLFGALAPVPVWLLSKAFPHKTWIRSINMPVLIGASGIMPPASSVNFTAWFVVGFIFNYIIFKYRKGWWQRHNYVLSAALDAGLAFMGVVLYATTGLENKSITWWGTNLDNCPLASCPTAPGIVRDGCPLIS